MDLQPSLRLPSIAPLPLVIGKIIPDQGNAMLDGPGGALEALSVAPPPWSAGAGFSSSPSDLLFDVLNAEQLKGCFSEWKVMLGSRKLVTDGIYGKIWKTFRSWQRKGEGTEVCHLVPGGCKLLSCQFSWIGGLRGSSSSRDFSWQGQDLPQSYPNGEPLGIDPLTRGPFEPLEKATRKWLTLKIAHNFR